MKYIYASQRVDVFTSYGERRDCLDQRWADFLNICGFALVPIPNHAETLKAMLTTLPPGGILLTGGNNSVSYGGISPERDETDAMLIDYAVSSGTPLVGVCRGMQSIVLYFGGTLKEIQNHVAARHKVSGEINREVNSYHTLATDSLPVVLEATAHSSDGIIEAIKHHVLPINGIMWHPEREFPYCAHDVQLIKTSLKSKE
jgi:putative glutamine amidotransferase